MQILIVYLYFLFFHPFHVSVTDVVYKEKKGFEIAIKLFTDDAELAIKNNYAVSTDLTKINEKNKELISRYLASRFYLQIDNKNFKQTFLGYEVENDAIWCYLEVNYSKKITSLAIVNSIFIDTYSDQINLVNYKNKETELSIRFSEKETKKAVF
jgi:hypothetical protein